METTAPTRIDTLRINGERLWDRLMQLAAIGDTAKGGVCRLKPLNSGCFDWPLCSESGRWRGIPG